MLFKKTPNKWFGRNGYNPEAIVIHITEGEFKGAKSWVKNPKSAVSYHYIINKKGKIAQIVKEKNSAWHTGIIKNPRWLFLKTHINPNLYTIGIALSGFAKDKPSLMQIVSASLLVKEIAARHNLEINEHTIIPHNAINADKNCPGPNIDIKTLIYLSRLPLT